MPSIHRVSPVKAGTEDADYGACAAAGNKVITQDDLKRLPSDIILAPGARKRRPGLTGRCG